MPTLINKKSKRISTFYTLKMRYPTPPKPCGAYYITNYSLRIESTIGGLRALHPAKYHCSAVSFILVTIIWSVFVPPLKILSFFSSSKYSKGSRTKIWYFFSLLLKA
jgi:hypothetical protein